MSRMRIPFFIFLLWSLLLPFSAAAGGKTVRFDFENTKTDEDGIPEDWTYRGKFATPDVEFRIVNDKEAGRILQITSDKGSGVIMRELSGVDLNKYPIMRWKWRADRLPAGADARVEEKDDQGLSIYIGYGRFRQTSVSYAWQTETPKGAKGKSVYNGLVTTYWFSVRNKEDGEGVWKTEERNVRDDILREFGTKTLPEQLALTISSNSQYTGTKCVMSLAYIEFSEN